MKSTFSKSLVVAGVAAALSGISTTATAAITGDAGEAFLIPYAYWTDGLPQGGASRLNTVVHVTIPSTVGGKTIPNVYTANNTTPRGAVVSPPAVSIPASQRPFDVFFNPPANRVDAWGIHYYFESFQSIDVCSGDRVITPEDFETFDLRDLCPNNGNQPGYLVLTTYSGSTGADADFAFFADAYLTADNSGSGIALAPATQVAWNLPALPLPDGDDAQGITETNQVVETAAPRLDVRPISSGIGTFGDPGSVKVIDLSLADRLATATPGNDGVYQARTLLYVWNDDNRTAWNPVLVHLFNDYEYGCNSSIPLPWELNLIWFTNNQGTLLAGGKDQPWFAPLTAVNASTGVVTDAPGYNWNPAACFPNVATDNGAAVDAFVRMQLPVAGASAPFSARTAMYAGSLQMWWQPTTVLSAIPGIPQVLASTVAGWVWPRGNSADGSGLADDVKANPSSVAHDRGVFASIAGAWTRP